MPDPTFVLQPEHPRRTHITLAGRCTAHRAHGPKRILVNMALRHLLLALLWHWAVMVVSQEATPAPALWLDREFRFWLGEPPVHQHEYTDHGEVDTEVMGFTDEDRRASFYRDGSFQEVVFVDRGFTNVRQWQLGDCDPLRGDTVAVNIGTWMWSHDTLHVTVERTAQYPLDALLDVYRTRDVARPFIFPALPTRVCSTERDRKFWFEDGRLAEAGRKWD